MLLTDLELVNLKSSYQAIQLFTNIMAASTVKHVKKLTVVVIPLGSSPLFDGVGCLPERSQRLWLLDIWPREEKV